VTKEISATELIWAFFKEHPKQQGIGPGRSRCSEAVQRRYDPGRKRKLRYEVVFSRSDEGVAVSCPCLAGCWSQGTDEDEALVNVADAVREYLAALAGAHRRENVREVEIAV